MPRKEKTPEEKKAWGEKMKALREAKKAKSTGVTGTVVEAPASTENDQFVPANQPVEVSPSAQVEETQGETELDQLKRHVQELEQLIRSQAQNQAMPPVPQGPQVTSRGIVGTVTKFSTNPSDYPDPCDRLFQEEKLTLQGFNRNWWDLDWNVIAVHYDTKDGLHVTEPKFQLKLIRIMPDPETQEPSKQRYVLWKGTFFEDPQAAIQVANQYGLPVTEQNEKLFLDEMRYLRVRDWLMEAFYPPKPAQDKFNKKEMVINNRLVEVFEINSTQSETMPFNQITKKL